MLSNNCGNRLNQYVSDYCIFDLETTGTSSTNDAVIEISAVKVINGEVVDEFSTLVNPERPIPFYASDVNGIYEDMVEDAPVFEKALADFLEFAGDLILVGHNIHTFDMKFIYRDAQKYWGKTIGNDYIDTLQIARAYLPQLSCHKLTALAEYYGIDPDGAHRALNDCRMNQQIFELLGKEMKNPSEEAKAIPKCPKCGNIPTMKSLDGGAKKSAGASNGEAFAPVVEEKIDFSNVKIEPLFEELVDFDTFSKSDFRAVKVKECVAVPKSKKLLQFTLDDGTGTDRTILSGIHAFYEPEELVGKTLIAITNFPPRPMMGIESCGMLLSAVNNLKDSDEEELHLIMVDNHIPAGAKLY